jgi:hypothetical protein
MVVVVLAVWAHWQRNQTPFHNAPKLISALQAFARDRTASGGELPVDVSLEDLVRGGYLTSNDVRAFAGMEVTFSTQLDAIPQSILARARMPDGQFVCLLADGSVQGFTASGLRRALDNSRQPGGATNRSQPVHPETNQTETAERSFTFVDGSVMKVKKQDGVLLEGIHLVQKLPNGVQTCDAQKGQMVEDADHRVVHVTLYDATVVPPSKQRMTVHELKVGLAK